MPSRNNNELKQDSQCYEDRNKKVVGGILFDIKKQTCMDIDYEEL